MNCEGTGDGADSPGHFWRRSEEDSRAWRRQFIQALLERDLPRLGIGIPAQALLRFWTMLAHYHGGIWNVGGACAILGGHEAHGPTLPGSPDGALYGAPASALA